MIITRRVSSVRRRDARDCSWTELRMAMIYRRDKALAKMVTIDGIILPTTKPTDSIPGQKSSLSLLTENECVAIETEFSRVEQIVDSQEKLRL